MELQHINVKVPVENPETIDLESLIPVLHGWIRGKAFDELLLDIADYQHVPAGPGVVLIGFEGDYSVDNTDNRLGVRYNRKAALDGSNQARLRQAARAALTACQKLEAEPLVAGKLRCNGREMEISINDRLVAPNTDATREAAKPDLEGFFRKLYAGNDFLVSYGSGDPRRLFSVTAKASRAFPIATLLANLDS